jgi:hypothetical protein
MSVHKKLIRSFLGGELAMPSIETLQKSLGLISTLQDDTIVLGGLIGHVLHRDTTEVSRAYRVPVR